MVESGGLVWVNTNGEAVPAEIPDYLRSLRSLSFNCPVALLNLALARARAAAPFGESWSVKVESQQPQVLSVAFTEPHHTVYIALQQYQATKTLAHVLVHEKLHTEERIGVSRWCESVRRQIEAS